MAQINGDAGNNVLNGTEDSDDIRGRGGADTINGAGGDDNLKGGAGADIVNGGDGNDEFFFDAASDLAAGEVLNGGAGNDLVDLNNLTGWTFDFRQISLVSIEAIEGYDFFIDNVGEYESWAHIRLTNAQLEAY